MSEAVRSVQSGDYSYLMFNRRGVLPGLTPRLSSSELHL